MPVSSPQRGDSFLLFHELPYDFGEALPLPIGPCVYLGDTPQALLKQMVGFSNSLDCHFVGAWMAILAPPVDNTPSYLVLCCLCY